MSRWVSGYAALYDDPHWVRRKQRSDGTWFGDYFECYAPGAFAAAQAHSAVPLFAEHDYHVGMTVELADDEIGLRFVGILQDDEWLPPCELLGVSLMQRARPDAVEEWTRDGLPGRRLSDVQVLHIGLVVRPTHRGTVALVTDRRPIVDGAELRRALLRRWPFAAERMTGGPPSEIHQLAGVGGRRG